VHLRELPKRPKSVFAMFSADHKDEVPKGKGEGKGTHALREKFAQVPKDELKPYEVKCEELTEKWKEDVTVFKQGPKYKTFEATKAKIVLEFKNEAIKVTTLKFLADSPASPPKTAFAIYVGEKRKAAGEPEGQKKSKEAKREEVVKAKEEWMKLDRVVRDGYESKRKDVLKSYEEDVKGFMAGDKWQDYQKEAKRLKIPIKSLLYHKKNIIKKTKDGKVSPASIPIPEKPDMYPLKPLSAIQIFMAEKKKTVDSVAEIHDIWKNLSPEDKASYDKQAAEQVQKHAVDMQEFRRSDEGRKYVRDLSGAQRRRRMIAARNNYLDDYPKKPTSAIFDWMRANLKKVRKEMPDAKGFELKNKLTEKWNALPAEEKGPLEKAATDRMEDYNQKMIDFKASDNWKKYLSATKAGFGKAKGKAKGGSGAPRLPDGMPKKPLNAFQAYMQEMAQNGKGVPLSEAGKAFGSLADEEKQRYLKEAQERLSQFKEEQTAFENSPAGKKYRLMNAAFIKRKRLNDLRSRFLKDEPTKGKGASALYFAANRAKVMEENPELKGLGPVQIKLSADFRALSAEDRQVWVDKEKAETEEYRQKVTDFQATENYKKYKRLSAAVLGMGKAKGKAKAAPSGVAMPPKPDSLPVAPQSGFFMFGEETRAGGGPRGIPEVGKLWKELGAEGQKEFNEKAKEARSKYENDMREFQKSAVGKNYLRLKMVAEKKGRLAAAKAKFLGGANAPQEPKRPASSYFIFLAQESGGVTGAANRADKAKELTAKWNALTAEEKKVFEDKAKELRDKYDEDMRTYKGSAGYKSYAKTLSGLTGGGARAANAKKAKVTIAKVAKGKAGKAAKPAAKAKAAKAAKPDNDSDDQMGSDSKNSKSSSKSSKSSSSSNSD